MDRVEHRPNTGELGIAIITNCLTRLWSAEKIPHFVAPTGDRTVFGIRIVIVDTHQIDDETTRIRGSGLRKGIAKVSKLFD